MRALLAALALAAAPVTTSAQDVTPSPLPPLTPTVAPTASPSPTPLPSPKPLSRQTVAFVGDSISVTVTLPSNPRTCKHGAYLHAGLCRYSHATSRAFPALVGRLTGVRIVNLAVSSMATDWMAAHEVPHIPRDADAVVIQGGTNDLIYAGPHDASDRFEALVTLVHRRAPRARLVVITLRRFGLPMVHRWNERMRSVAGALGARVVDLETDPAWYVASDWPDGVHPSASGVHKLGEAVAAALR